MLMSGSRVVISEPQAGRQEAAKQLVIWCGLRYHSPGAKLCVCVCVSERHAEPQVRLHQSATCVHKVMEALGLIPRDDAEFQRMPGANNGHDAYKLKVVEKDT